MVPIQPDRVSEGLQRRMAENPQIQLVLLYVQSLSRHTQEDLRL